jgi:hypothetical protein
MRARFFNNQLNRFSKARKRMLAISDKKTVPDVLSNSETFLFARIAAAIFFGPEDMLCVVLTSFITRQGMNLVKGA